MRQFVIPTHVRPSICLVNLVLFLPDFKKEYSKVGSGINKIHEAFITDGLQSSQQLNNALAETGKAYHDIANMCGQQVILTLKFQWMPYSE